MPYNISVKHTDACNELIAIFHECTAKHPIRRVFGYCNDQLKESEEFCRYEAKLKKQANFERSRTYDKEKLKSNREEVKFQHATNIMREELAKISVEK